MEEINTSIVELVPEYLVIVSQLEPTLNIIRIKVYDRELFFVNPNPLVNENQLGQYSICPSCYNQTVSEIRDMYAGWSKIDRTQPMKLIGIHNQDPKNLYIQFSLGERCFIYERSLELHREVVYEELFGKKHNHRQRALSSDDEKYLVSKLRFLPKTKKAISFYPFKATSGHTYIRRHLS
ncbi:hypothetical protein [Desulfosporosinus sp. OT]|uniref:hypothetical protein n=1 Tax=Desulfosporosinus sp. OT TaxID=913865 RepID=UPI000317717E|nr:hypothetical protein [Desulfosporosinus sp. OT]